MEYRQLGRSGLRVPSLTLGTMTFGGRGPFRQVGDTGLEGARRQIDMALEAARTDEQLADNLAAAELQLSDDENSRLEAVSRPPLIYPYWHQRKMASDRLSASDLPLIGPYLTG
jgi:aryl-alcohol dehydrogenase-like predicted oxidoreductase